MKKKKKNYTNIHHVVHGVSKAEYWRVLMLRTMGNFLILFSLYMLSWVFYKPFVEEVKYFAHSVMNKQFVIAEKNDDGSFKLQDGGNAQNGDGKLSGLLKNNNVEVLVPSDPQFSIVIPKLGANAKVIPNVDVTESKSYMQALEKGVAHADGTKFPGENGHIYLFAHSTNTFTNVSRYNAVFYLLYKLDPGDEINIFYKGARHKYIVKETKIVNPNEIQYLTRTTTSEFLTLQTCWPPGTISKRMMVFAEPAK